MKSINNNMMCHNLRFEFDQGNVLRVEAVITDPLCIYLLCEVMEGNLSQASAGPVEPEVTAGLAEDGLVVLVHLLPADTAGVDRRGRGVLLVEYDGLVRRVDSVPAQGSGGAIGRDHVQRWRSHARRPGRSRTDPA